MKYRNLICLVSLLFLVLSCNKDDNSLESNEGLIINNEIYYYVDTGASFYKRRETVRPSTGEIIMIPAYSSFIVQGLDTNKDNINGSSYNFQFKASWVDINTQKKGDELTNIEIGILGSDPIIDYYFSEILSGKIVIEEIGSDYIVLSFNNFKFEQDNKLSLKSLIYLLNGKVKFDIDNNI